MGQECWAYCGLPRVARAPPRLCPQHSTLVGDRPPDSCSITVAMFFSGSSGRHTPANCCKKPAPYHDLSANKHKMHHCLSMTAASRARLVQGSLGQHTPANCYKQPAPCTSFVGASSCFSDDSNSLSRLCTKHHDSAMQEDSQLGLHPAIILGIIVMWLRMTSASSLRAACTQHLE